MASDNIGIAQAEPTINFSRRGEKQEEKRGIAQAEPTINFSRRGEKQEEKRKKSTLQATQATISCAQISRLWRCLSFSARGCFGGCSLRNQVQRRRDFDQEVKKGIENTSFRSGA
ncbi:unnamed protein product [Dovyalis caffra]|uniref:Uncharacterized protein n=1 Tax=Dovyalis caffra TaxID=77055 RepID=A0AAV1QWS2_9ROSI|nr:unnamed protein product [Dovyalis caffra]